MAAAAAARFAPTSSGFRSTRSASRPMSGEGVTGATTARKTRPAALLLPDRSLAHTPSVSNSAAGEVADRPAAQ